MPLFHYTARNKRGASLEGTMPGQSRQEVAQQLSKKGITPIEIDLVKVPQPDALSRLWLMLKSEPLLVDMIAFCHQMYTLIKAGVPIISALHDFTNSKHNPRLLNALTKVSHDLECGQNLATALSHHPTVFSNLFVNVVRVGENTGHLKDAFFHMAKYLELEKDTRDRIKAGLRSPAFAFLAIGIAIAVVSVVVIPVFAGMYARANVELAWETRLIMNVSDFMIVHWSTLLLGSLMFVIALRFLLNTKPVRYQWDKYKLRLPIIGKIISRLALGRYARSFSVALTNGVPLIQALTDVAKVDNAYMREQISRMRNAIEGGETLSRAAQASGLFTPMVLRMIEVGEETGEVDNLLLEVAEFYEREVDYAIKKLGELMEPILLAAVSVIILILALGVLLPVWDMVSLYKKHGG